MTTQPPLATSLTLTMPEWFGGLVTELPDAVEAVEDRMAIVNDLAHRNFEYGTGGPFAAGVFERDSGRIVSLGVNRVVPLGKSCAHAEFMAISLAQEALGSWDLGAEGLPAHQLVVNWRPCVMCFGSTLWSGVVDLVLAGAGPELEALTGFDEGPIHPDWELQLQQRGIALTLGVGNEAALAVFRAFGESGALVYNGRGGGRR
jgi:tRNA(Arg) A34 adenosine deaminase TadA